MDKLIANLRVRFPELTEEDILLSVEIILDAMSARLSKGERIELRGFGSFNLYARKQIPEDYLMVDTHDRIPEVPMIYFKPGRIIRERLEI